MPEESINQVSEKLAEVTTIIRVHSERCFPFLERALFSLVGQKVNLNVIIVTQRFDVQLTKSLKNATSKYVFGSLKDIAIINASCTDREDLRSLMINMAVPQVKTRFIHFLDFDDVMYPNAFADLTAPLKKTSAAISFGGIISTFYEQVAGRPYIISKRREFFGRHKFDMFVDNFCPIHSFVLDKTKIDIDDINFDESMSALEDYNFLIGFLAKYDADFSLIDKPVGEYFRRDDDSVNSADVDYPDPSLKISRLQKAREKILEKKRSTNVTIRVSEFAWLLGHSAPSAKKEMASPINEGEKFAINRFSDKIGLIFCNNMLQLAQEANELEGYVDTFRAVNEGIIVEGWINNYAAEHEGSYLLLCINENGFISEAERYHRSDVDEHLGTSGFNYGFRFLVPDHRSNVDYSDINVYLVEKGHRKIYKIKVLEGS